MPRFNSINFYENRSKIKSFLRKNTKVSSAGGSALIPPKQIPLLQISGYVPEQQLKIIIKICKLKVKTYYP